MIFHENRLLADDSHLISYLIFCQKLGKMSQNLSSAAVVIGALRVNMFDIKPLTGRKQHKQLDNLCDNLKYEGSSSGVIRKFLHWGKIYKI